LLQPGGDPLEFGVSLREIFVFFASISSSFCRLIAERLKAASQFIDRRPNGGSSLRIWRRMNHNGC
jgi:hypothetical protein